MIELVRDTGIQPVSLAAVLFKRTVFSYFTNPAKGSMMEIVWKDVVGYEDLLMISSCGKVWSKRTNKQLKTTVSKKGYEVFATKIGGRLGKNICLKVHRLVALAFIEAVEGKNYVNHIDGDKLNNKVCNLEWVTLSENSVHAVMMGLYSPPTNEDQRRLSDDDLLYIQEQYKPKDKEFGFRALARKFGVSHTTIRGHVKSNSAPLS